MPTPHAEPPTRDAVATRRVALGVLGVLHRWAESGWSGAAAFTWGVLQSAVLPGPSDAVLIPLALADRRRALPLTGWTILGAITGALVAYAMGALAYHSVGLPVLTWLGVTAEHLRHIDALMRTRGWLVVALASLPLGSSKAAAIVAGAFAMPLGEFALVTLVVRGGRFVLEGLLLRFAGGWVARRLGRG